MSKSLNVKCLNCGFVNSKRYDKSKESKNIKCSSCGKIIDKKLVESSRRGNLKKRIVGCLKN